MNPSVPLGPPWSAADLDAEGWEAVWRTAADDSPAALFALWRGAVERSRAAMARAFAGGGADQPSKFILPSRLGPVSARRSYR